MSVRFIVETLGLGVFRIKRQWADPVGYLMAAVEPTLTGTPREEEAVNEGAAAAQASIIAQHANEVRQQLFDFVGQLVNQGEIAEFKAGARYVTERLLECGEIPEEPVKATWWMVDVLPIPPARLMMLKTSGEHRNHPFAIAEPSTWH